MWAGMEGWSGVSWGGACGRRGGDRKNREEGLKCRRCGRSGTYLIILLLSIFGCSSISESSDNYIPSAAEYQSITKMNIVSQIPRNISCEEWEVGRWGGWGMGHGGVPRVCPICYSLKACCWPLELATTLSAGRQWEGWQM